MIEWGVCPKVKISPYPKNSFGFFFLGGCDFLSQIGIAIEPKNGGRMTQQDLYQQFHREVDAVRNFKFESMCSHLDQILDLQERIEEEQGSLHPDSDEYEQMEFWAEDVLQPMLNHLEAQGEDGEFYFESDYITAEMAKRAEGKKQWKEITGLDF